MRRNAKAVPARELAAPLEAAHQLRPERAPELVVVDHAGVEQRLAVRVPRRRRVLLKDGRGDEPQLEEHRGERRDHRLRPRLEHGAGREHDVGAPPVLRDGSRVPFRLRAQEYARSCGSGELPSVPWRAVPVGRARPPSVAHRPRSIQQREQAPLQPGASGTHSTSSRELARPPDTRSGRGLAPATRATAGAPRGRPSSRTPCTRSRRGAGHRRRRGPPLPSPSSASARLHDFLGARRAP